MAIETQKKLEDVDDRGKCRVCGDRTNTLFNIGFSMVHICEDCARSIFIQQAKWYITAKIKNK